MKIIFDNDVPNKLRRYLPNHEITFARHLGWGQLKNGLLLARAEEAGFEVMVTGDKNLSYQQNLTGRKMALIVLGTIQWPALEGHCALVAEAVKRAKLNSFEQLPTPPYVPSPRKRPRMDP